MLHRACQCMHGLRQSPASQPPLFCPSSQCPPSTCRRPSPRLAPRMTSMRAAAAAPTPTAPNSPASTATAPRGCPAEAHFTCMKRCPCGETHLSRLPSQLSAHRSTNQSGSSCCALAATDLEESHQVQLVLDAIESFERRLHVWPPLWAPAALPLGSSNQATLRSVAGLAAEPLPATMSRALPLQALNQGNNQESSSYMRAVPAHSAPGHSNSLPGPRSHT